MIQGVSGVNGKTLNLVHILEEYDLYSDFVIYGDFTEISLTVVCC